ncbi:hypothetical protein PCL_12673 [Purpureocillium lilacinum]|uniref:Uncharacterized protein n=1 Tax=Purpureocillium lilacinum TaxID=33203 RepID=A0A2U3DPC5_PURLI|nr:hypothetical protein PCL_12673 [Purpureocillium lilacinum]
MVQGKTPAERHHAMQECMKQGIRDVLLDEDKWPKELIFVRRNTRIVQGDDQYLGSPVNRVKRLQNAWRHFVFKAFLVATDVPFYLFKLRQWLGIGGGMEDEMDKRIKDVGQGFGIELQHEVFEA